MSVDGPAVHTSHGMWTSGWLRQAGCALQWQLLPRLKLSIVVAELLLQVAPRGLSATADVPRPAHLAAATRRAPVQLLLHKYLLTEAGAEVLVRGHTQGFAFTFL